MRGGRAVSWYGMVLRGSRACFLVSFQFGADHQVRLQYRHELLS